VCHFLVDASRYGFTVRTVEAPFFRRVARERAERADTLPVEAAADSTYASSEAACLICWDQVRRPCGA